MDLALSTNAGLTGGSALQGIASTCVSSDGGEPAAGSASASVMFLGRLMIYSLTNGPAGVHFDIPRPGGRGTLQRHDLHVSCHGPELGRIRSVLDSVSADQGRHADRTRKSICVTGLDHRDRLLASVDRERLRATC